MSRKLKRILAAVLAVVVVSSVAVGIYAADFYKADSVAVSSFSEAKISDDYAVFGDGDVGFIFYPGGKVEYSAYAPLMHRLAEGGITCVIAKMPLNLAVLDTSAWKGAKKAAPNVKNWFIGGHSLGGAMASGVPQDQFEGLILLAAYPTKKTEIPVLSLLAENDNVLNKEKYAEALPLMPEGFKEITIEGGCHAYFGSYGVQKGDGTPLITNSEQLNKTAEYILEFIKGITE